MYFLVTQFFVDSRCPSRTFGGPFLLCFIMFGKKRGIGGKYFSCFERVIDLQSLKEGQRLYCMGWELLPPSLLSSQSSHLLLPSAPPLIFHSSRLLPPPLSFSRWHTELKCHHYPVLWLASAQTLGEPSSTATWQLELPAPNAPQHATHAPPPHLAATAQFFVLLSFCYLSQAD